VKTANNSQTTQGTQRVIVPSDSSNVLKDFGKRKVSETISIPSHAPSMSDGEASTSSAPCVDT
jgi:hypothetical protein